MPRQAKVTPIKSCEWCGKHFERKRVGKLNQLECVSNYMRRRFCTISCAASSQHAKPAETRQASRKRARAFVGPCCEACESTLDLVVHHVNGDPMNNSADNMQTLCSPCHSFFHATQRRTGRLLPGRMGRLFA